MDHIANVQSAGVNLADAIRAARAAGYRVDFAAAGLESILVSETMRVGLAPGVIPTVTVEARRPIVAADEPVMAESGTLVTETPPATGAPALPPIVHGRSGASAAPQPEVPTIGKAKPATAT